MPVCALLHTPGPTVMLQERCAEQMERPMFAVTFLGQLKVARLLFTQRLPWQCLLSPYLPLNSNGLWERRTMPIKRFPYI